MPSIRIGLSTDFNLVGEQVGIGTTNPTARLDVAGQILADNTAGSGGVSTFREYQGFYQTQSNVSHKVTIDATTAGNLNSLSGELRIDGDVTIAPDTSVTSGKIDSLTATDKFAVPLGDTNSRDNAPEAGTTRFNQDFGTLEFFDGVNWKIVNKTSRSGRAVFFGGYIGPSGATQTASMDLINIPTLGNSINFGNLGSVRDDTQGCSDGTRGLCAGGYSSAVTQRITDTEYITLASVGNSIQFGDLIEPRNAFGGCSSSTRGLFAGGINNAAASPSVLQIDYFQISTLGTALDFGDSATSRAISGGIPSSTRAVWGAGNTRAGSPATVTAVSMMDYSTFASKGNAVEFGNDILPRTTGNGCSSGTRGVFAGGYGSGAIYSSPSSREMGRKMSYITIASTGNAIEFGELTSGARTYIASNSTSTRGIWTGGSSYPTHYDSIEYVQFSSLGNTIDFGNLHSFKGYMTGSASDSHGGLGGF